MRNKDFPYENGKCTYLDYNVSSDGKVYETAHALSKDGQVTSGSGEGYCEDNSGECYVKMGHSPVYGGQFILGTDYDSYLTMYHCSNWWVVNWQYGWIFSRNSQSEVNLDDVDYFDQTYLVADDFMFTDQNDCSAVY